MYIIDTTEATDARLLQPSNENLSKNLLRDLDFILREINPFASAFKQMKDFEITENQNAIRQNRPVNEVSMAFLRYNKNTNDGHGGRYNIPKVGDIAAIFTSKDGEPPLEIDIRIYPKNQTSNSRIESLRNLNIQSISENSPNCDPMSYPLLFPYGEPGWHYNLEHAAEFRTASRTRVTLADFYAYKIADRAVWSSLHMGSNLFKQYLVDSYIKIERNRLRYIKENQSKLKVESYQGLMDYVRNNWDGPLGRVSILPSTYIVYFFSTY